MVIVHALAQVLADVPNPGPVDPTQGAKGVGLLVSYVKWGVLIACGLSALASGGMMAVGSLSNRPDAVDKGKRALLWSLGGVIVVSVAIPMVNTVFGAAG
ncbi:hypothetical protein [Pilimelia columellifera]|uniref:Uncharacterized protein n=1 Tax=Pilimelia columellifera subsp. columellifera TaxID=706583 RepID=A0ABN3NJT2_9ACTN